MGVTPRKYLSDLSERRPDPESAPDGKTALPGWLALSPLAVFLVLYLVSSLIAKDFYKVPIAAAFLLASIYAVGICRARGIAEKVAVFSRGAGDKNVLLMIWIFVLAGAFAHTASDIGAVEATVNLTLALLPAKWLLAGLFLAACIISMAIGTSVGTIVALVPIAAGIATQSGLDLALVTATIVGGAFFGDNLSFISDTTIAATRTQDCAMADKFKANIWIALPAALLVTAIYAFLGFHLDARPTVGSVHPLLLLPYLTVIVLALCGMDVTAVLSIGLGINLLLGLCTGGMGWTAFLGSVGAGIAGMGDLIIVTLLAGGMMEVIRHGGGIDFLVRRLTLNVRTARGAGLSIAALVSLAGLCTANNTVAIITTGPVAKSISEKFGLSKVKAASILDTFSCVIQGLIPYGAQLLMASGLAGVSAFSLIGRLYYPPILALAALAAILFRYPRKYS